MNKKGLSALGVPVLSAALLAVGPSLADAQTQAPKAILMTATSYAPTAKDNYPYPAVDYFGSPLKLGDVAVDPRVIPLGTRLQICGYHSPYLPPGCMMAMAVDEGNAIRGKRIDIFINGTEAMASSFGIQKVTVTLLGKGSILSRIGQPSAMDLIIPVGPKVFSPDSLSLADGPLV